MKYRVRHVTRYDYAEAISVCHNEARLEPRSLPEQQVLDTAVRVIPEPSAVFREVDYFGNVVHSFSLQEPHASLEVTSESEVEVAARAPLAGADSPAWEDVAARLALGPAQERDAESLAALELTFPSPWVPLERRAVAYAKSSFTRGRPLLDGVAELNRRLFEDFTYCPGATDMLTPLGQVMETRSGVCQDFAHLLVAMLRGHGLAARYVSGYLRTRPPPGRPPLVGADASHAWVGVYCPGVGYVDFDPTNGVCPTDEHITVAWGRDYGDVAPLKGVLLGAGQHTVRVGVTVEAL